MTSSPPKKQAYLIGKVKEYFSFTTRRIVRTPERSLEKAYECALKIKDLEDEYFYGETITSDAVSESTVLSSVIRADVDKHLTIAKLRLAEFKASSFVLGELDRQNISKLKVVEEVIARYKASDSQSSAAIVPLLSGSSSNSSISGEFSSLDELDTAGDFPSSLGRTSLGRTISKLKTDFNPKGEENYIRTFRSSKAKSRIALRFAIILIVVPLIAQHASKQFIISPIVSEFRESNNASPFLHNEMKEEAFKELNTYKETLEFQHFVTKSPELSEEAIEEKLVEKAEELNEEFREKSNSAVSNVFADIFALFVFGIVALVRRKDFIVLKSFLDDLVYGLSDTAKAFILILFTDIFVGFHSPHGWDVLLEGIAGHLGVEPNKSAINIFIATFPVILDTIFKYWVFRYLSRISPSAVATLKDMNE
ncbi:MAG: proton extrusion protein PcxA [Cyanobacteria bacterium J06639_18]